MKIILFIVVLIAAFFLIPDRWVNDIFMRHISVTGDGEEAMNNYAFTLLLIKTGLAVVIAALALWSYRLFKR
ncbi:hypothetical protein POH93_24475 [Phytobacter diazotrophicus]|uniref:hypothetical protein n=1 Tax=Phytobacter diazotrophicus TaxID=395631 RepID=UPI002330FF8A|nr:hypothetical protein [Phytobacter diazotrophicus]MDC0728523.1 hypothetical protein [Phytobacter diazotrophicus]MDC0735717.1 hypothetical protein [Phytobacter diazotrophicus]